MSASGSKASNGDAKAGISYGGPQTIVMGLDEDTPPGKVLEYAAACVRFVATTSKVEPDFTADTLPLVDHYIEQARKDIASRPEVLALTANAIGAYIGELVRRGPHHCWWRIDHADTGAWRLEFRSVYLSFYPIQIAYAALTRQEDESTFSGFELPQEDHNAMLRRLADLPQVSEREYYMTSTRVEVLDIVVDGLLAKRASSRDPVRPYRPSDYGVSEED